MENVRKILTPSAIWKGFHDDLPLKESKVNEMAYDGINYTEVYFSGRETETGRVRIYGLYARPQPLPSRKLGAVLILPDCGATVDLETVNYFAKMGYAVLMVDYRGETGESSNHTNYPTDINYANFIGNDEVFKVNRTAKETCWYEWVAVGKYALSYLNAKPEIERIGVIGIKQGANVAWQLLYNESRVSCFVPLFGIGWQAYKNVFKSDGGDIKMDDERYRWLGGVDAHVYAQYINCPVFYVAGTNSPDFDCERGIDTLARVKAELKCSFNYAPRFRNVINKKCCDDIALFLKKYLTKSGQASDKLYFPESPQLNLAMSDDKFSIYAELTPKNFDKLKTAAVYISEGTADPSKRNWINMKPVRNKGDANKKYFKLRLGGGCDFVNAFAVLDYKNGVSISSRIFHKKIDPVPISTANMLFSSKDGTDCFTIYEETANSVGKLLFPENTGVELAECASGIAGVTSRYGLLTYKIGEKRFKTNEKSIIKADVYCEEYVSLCVSLIVSEEEKFQYYSSTVDLKGSKVWQKVQMTFGSFKNENRMGIKDYDNIIAIKINSESRFAVNNILLI